MTARYKRVSQTDPEGEEESKKSRGETVEKISAKIQALAWILGSVVIVAVTDLPTVIHSDKINRMSLNLSIVCFIANCGIILYLTLWLPLVLKVTLPWEIYCPNMIPLSTVLSVLCFFTLMVAFWPVWGMITPLYVTVLTMGLIFTSHFIPWPC